MYCTPGSQAPFRGPASLAGTFTFSSSSPIAVIALRGLTNERGQFLLTTLPVADLGTSTGSSSVIFPDFADGGGWTTQVILVNPSDSSISGTVQFRDQSGLATNVTVSNQLNNSFSYFIPARSAQKLLTAGTGGTTKVGSVRVTPTSGVSPSGLAVFSYRFGGVTVSEAGVPAVQAASAFRIYAEAAGSMQTGIAITNTSSSTATVTVDVTRLDGSSLGLTGSLSIPANGQSSAFLNQITGLTQLPASFQGVARVSSSSSIAIVGLRGRYNEVGDFLITTTPPVNEAGNRSAWYSCARLRIARKRNTPLSACLLPQTQ